MLEQIIVSLQNVSDHPLGLLFALLLGVVSAATSACCTLPALSVLVGYSGSQANRDKKTAIQTVLIFTIGIILSLMIIGAIAGFVGQTAQFALGKYWKLFAGVVAIFLGLASTNLLPFKISFGSFAGVREKAGSYGILVSGLLLGGIVAASSLPCNPGIFIVIGASILQGKVLWAVLMLAMFAIGFSLPLGAVLLGISLTKVSFAAKGFDTTVRWIAGTVLILAGFYFLLGF